MGPPTTENQRRLDVVDIQGALHKNEDEEMHDSANAPSSDLLEKTTKEPFQMDSHLTEEKQPMKTKELDSDSAVTGQVDEAEKGPQEKLNYKIEVITEHFPEQQVQEGTTESTKEIKLDAEYQDNKTQNANLTSVLTEKVCWVKTRTL